MSIDESEHRGRFDRAVQLFNLGQFYEAHEDWEALWLEAEGDYRLWLQGLIQYAAAFVHFRRGFYERGYSRLMVQATEKCEGYEGETDHIAWPALFASLQPFIAHGKAVAEGAPLNDPSLPALPTIKYIEGYEPQPLPLDAQDD